MGLNSRYFWSVYLNLFRYIIEDSNWKEDSIIILKLKSNFSYLEISLFPTTNSPPDELSIQDVTFKHFQLNASLIFSRSVLMKFEKKIENPKFKTVYRYLLTFSPHIKKRLLHCSASQMTYFVRNLKFWNNLRENFPEIYAQHHVFASEHRCIFWNTCVVL